MTDIEYLQKEVDVINEKIRISKSLIDEMDEKDRIKGLENYLDGVIEKMLYKSEREQLIQTINLKDSRGRIQKSINQFNQYLEENKMPYAIRSYTDWNRTNGHPFKIFRESNPNYSKVYWTIFKTNKTAIHNLFHNNLAETIIM